MSKGFGGAEKVVGAPYGSAMGRICAAVKRKAHGTGISGYTTGSGAEGTHVGGMVVRGMEAVFSVGSACVAWQRRFPVGSACGCGMYRRGMAAAFSSRKCACA